MVKKTTVKSELPGKHKLGPTNVWKLNGEIAAFFLKMLQFIGSRFSRKHGTRGLQRLADLSGSYMKSTENIFFQQKNTLFHDISLIFSKFVF